MLAFPGAVLLVKAVGDHPAITVFILASTSGLLTQSYSIDDHFERYLAPLSMAIETAATLLPKLGGNRDLAPS
ncbi:MAG: hypothetical protein ACYDAG_00935 [Chloroflexota bacterium]